MPGITVTAHQGDTVDSLCYRHLGSSADVERTLALNPGLAALGPVLPDGTAVTLPAASAGAATPRTLLQLWD
jgi:phage tail protein X